MQTANQMYEAVLLSWMKTKIRTKINNFRQKLELKLGIISRMKTELEQKLRVHKENRN